MYDEQKAMRLDNELRWRQREMQENTSEIGDWRMAKAFENLLSTIAGTETDAEFVTKLREWVNAQAEYLADRIEKREAVRAKINDIETEIAANV